jgi:hypothetical protein
MAIARHALFAASAKGWANGCRGATLKGAQNRKTPAGEEGSAGVSLG